jgi:transcriptional regulator with XRE-family HTH domain
MLAPMSAESLPHRVRRLVAEAVKAGRCSSERDVMDAAGLSPSYLAERINAANKDPSVSIRQATLVRIAVALGISVADLTGDVGGEAPLVDVYPSRAWAIMAARNLQLPEAAIQVVLREDPGHDPGRLYWFRRIESETERLRPSSSFPHDKR